jgi:hypothetical protein
LKAGVEAEIFYFPNLKKNFHSQALAKRGFKKNLNLNFKCVLQFEKFCNIFDTLVILVAHKIKSLNLKKCKRSQKSRNIYKHQHRCAAPITGKSHTKTSDGTSSAPPETINIIFGLSVSSCVDLTVNDPPGSLFARQKWALGYFAFFLLK